ncbi:hypothetical protein C8F01DRAFT_1367463 [Mycena amicta]|nr:hypothetical protein C8F01DRAFT_1367463 [Mycena amicta]
MATPADHVDQKQPLLEKEPSDTEEDEAEEAEKTSVPKAKPKVVYANRYSNDFKFRPAASPVITETLKDGRTRVRGAAPTASKPPPPKPTKVKAKSKTTKGKAKKRSAKKKKVAGKK